MKRGDKNLNWNEYSIPSFDISGSPPKTVRRLTKHSHSHRAHRPPIHNNIISYSNSMSDLNSRPPPITATSSLVNMNMRHRSNSNTNEQCQPMNININSYNWNGMNNSSNNNNNNNSNSVSPYNYAHTPYKMHNNNNINNRNSPPGIAMGGNIRKKTDITC